MRNISIMTLTLKSFYEFNTHEKTDDYKKPTTLIAINNQINCYLRCNCNSDINVRLKYVGNVVTNV